MVDSFVDDGLLIIGFLGFQAAFGFVHITP